MIVELDSRHHVRCLKCWARRVLPKHPASYKRLPVCRAPGCGSRRYFVDKWMMQRNTSTRGKRAMGCTCGGYHFLHRKASPYCWKRKDNSDRLPGDKDFKGYGMEKAA